MFLTPGYPVTSLAASPVPKAHLIWPIAVRPPAPGGETGTIVGSREDRPIGGLRSQFEKRIGIILHPYTE